MTTLTNAQRQKLRSLAHHLKPTTHVGKNGLSESVIASVDHELDAHELIKVKFQDFKEERHALADELVAATGSILITIIGNIAILYRQHPDPEKRTVRLTR
ncbi:MAG TPA: ribosome assembly RNA-binding protein YhbY [Roseiflexaceae bacterium]|mgnify:CR=1 FL=1|nr:ribosome assembly RNA-binding protein YhbY [Roseiflexaceae bacterium]HMP40107.1 ribosome assembly RNA-binding protein YhbY [Roseiflexaceae bacterium]